MVHESEFRVGFFSLLTELDEGVARRVAAKGCPGCEGPLHRGDYERKPRGALFAAASEAFRVRHSLCRVVPSPGVATVGALLGEAGVRGGGGVGRERRDAARLGRGSRESRDRGVPRRTLRRWRAWWREELPRSPLWSEQQARFVPPPPDAARLPLSLVERLDVELARSEGHAPTLDEITRFVARLLGPLTTSSVTDGACFFCGRRRCHRHLPDSRRRRPKPHD